MEDQRENEHRPIQVCSEKRLHQVVTENANGPISDRRRLLIIYQATVLLSKRNAVKNLIKSMGETPMT